MAKIVEAFKNDNGDIKSVRLKVGKSKSNEVCTILLVLLIEQEEVRFPNEEHQ